MDNKIIIANLKEALKELNPAIVPTIDCDFITEKSLETARHLIEKTINDLERKQNINPLTVKTGEQIFDEIDTCFNKHSSTGYNMLPEEVPEYEKEMKTLARQKWIKVEGLVAIVDCLEDLREKIGK